MKIAILNGPNLNKIGQREPEIYGSQTFEMLLEDLKADHPEVEFSPLQSNIEGVLIDYLQELDEKVDAVVFNAGAYTHTSIALADAIRTMQIPVVEVHMSNVFKREEFRHKSYLSPVVAGVILGFGMDSYKLAVQAIKQMKND